VLLLAVAAGSAGAQTPVAAALDNPRGLAFGSDGTLYVAEAGRGGTAPCYVTGDGAENCVGPTGAVTEVRKGVQRRLVSSLPSAAEPGGGGATGPHDVSLLGNGNIVVSLGLGANPALTAPGGPLAGTGLASLIQLRGRSAVGDNSQTSARTRRPSTPTAASTTRIPTACLRRPEEPTSPTPAATRSCA